MPILTLICGGLLLGDAILWFSTGQPPSDCSASHAALPPRLGIVAVVACGLSFIIGGLTAGSAWLPLRDSAAGSRVEDRRRHYRPGLNIQLVLVLFIALVATLLAYETLAVAGFNGWPPITWAVRCDSHLHPNTTLLGAAAICGLLGHWLWYRPRRTEPRGVR